MSVFEIMPGIAPDGAPIVSVITAMHYLVDSDGKLVRDVAGTQLQLLPEYYVGIEYPGRYHPSLLARDIDVYPWRDSTDVIVQGHARALEPVVSLVVRLDCRGEEASFTRAIRVTGDRVVERSGARLSLTPPKPFVEMPMRYDKAYGGTDERAEAALADPELLALSRRVLGDDEHFELGEFSYPRNPAGKGFAVSPDHADGLAWPNLEFLDELACPSQAFEPLERWGERPVPACFDWLSHASFPRCAWFGHLPLTHDGAVPKREVELGLVPADLGELALLERDRNRVAQGAHPYLRGHRLRGNEILTIDHMGEPGRPFVVALPGQRPRIELGLAGAKPEPLEPTLDLVCVSTDDQLVRVVWRGTRRCDALHVTLGSETNCAAEIHW